METYPNARHIPYAPTETADLYPESDGKPMAETEISYYFRKSRPHNGDHYGKTVQS